MNLPLPFHIFLAQASDFSDTTTTPDYSGDPTAGGIIGGIVGAIFWLVVLVLLLASLWKICVKAGRQGWEGIIPIYNYWVLAEIGGKPGWWGLLMLVPCVNIVFLFLICIAVAQSFGKSAGFGIGLALLSPIFFPILAFGDARYLGPAGGVPGATLPPRV